MDDELRPAGRHPVPRRGTKNDPGTVLRLHHGNDLIEAIPYLIGFQPRDSVVLVGIEGGPPDGGDSGGRVRITVRMDIADLWTPAHGLGSSADDAKSVDERDDAESVDERNDAESVDEGARRAAAAIRRSGATAVLGVVFADSPTAVAHAGEAANRAGHACAEAGLELGDVVVVTAPRFGAPARAGGQRRTSRVAAEATYAGLVALDDRRDLVELLAADPPTDRERLRPALDAEQRLATAEDVAGHRRRRSAIRALFAATRTLAVVEDTALVRFGAALRTVEVRDACWLAVEAARVDGEALWRELARRLPGPYDAAPLFLFGWQRWRNGDGVLAAIAARRALDSDAGYTAAGLLQLAVTDGLDPFRTPRLRKGA